ncbi:FAD-dependent oxidoreductase, partial [Slackia exigua]
MSRRDALKLGGLAGLGALTASLAACAPKDAGAKAASGEMNWDKEADVVIIGSGTGSYTAMRLAHAGLSVIVLEKNAQTGGSTIFSSSVVWAPMNDLEVAEGIDDSREEALRYI